MFFCRFRHINPDKLRNNKVLHNGITAVKHIKMLSLKRHNKVVCSFQLTLFVAVWTHKNQDKPLVLDANVSASHGWRSRLKTLEQAQIFSACSTITLRALHQPQGDKQEINIISVV